MKMRKPLCFDVCCGAGVFSLGFKKEGFRILGGIDSDKYAIETTNSNFPEGNWGQIKIEDYAADLARNGFKKLLNPNVIVAGLPCQGFSVAGKRDPSDHRNKLYKDLLKIVGKTKPEFVVIENVKGLLSEKNERVFKSILNGLEGFGYDVDCRLYDAVTLDTPQFRKRVFIVGSMEIPVRYVLENIRHSNRRIAVREALKGLYSKRENKKNNHTFMVHGTSVKRKIARIKDAQLISYRRLAWNQPALTIITGHNALPVHPKEHRAISIREAARLQGIPDTFIFKGPRGSQSLQVANAVPLPMASAIARAIKTAPAAMKAARGSLFKFINLRTSGKIKQEFLEGFTSYYKEKGFKFPWRKVSDPYKILLTEILLQRTNGKMVNGVWGDVMNCVEKTESEFRVDWPAMKRAVKKIGIFNRVQTIKHLNEVLSKNYYKKVPSNFEELSSLPGVGIYIAAAVRTFAFKIPDFPVDSNAFRFISRFFGKKIAGKKSEARQIREYMNTVIDKDNPKDFVYGFLDFCSTVCTPKKPKCGECFLRRYCKYPAR